jgi:hypothetical protein
MAVGSYETIDRLGTLGIDTLAERWNGTRWSIERTLDPGGSVGSSLAGVSCTSTATCTAVGSINLLPPGTPGSLAERWEGSRWSLQTTPSPRQFNQVEQSELLSVSCPSRRMCVAAGTSDKGGLVDRWPQLATAKLTGVPAACVRAPFTARVSGKGIASVVWRLGHTRISGRTVQRGRQYAALISLSPGMHELIVKVRFAAYTHIRARTFDEFVFGCRSHHTSRG